MYEYSKAGAEAEERLARTASGCPLLARPRAVCHCPDLRCTRTTYMVPAQGVDGNVAVVIGYWYWYYTSHLDLGLALLAMRLLLRTVHSTQAAIAIAIARYVLGGASGRDLGLRVL